MPINKKVFVSIYCKIYTDNFSDEMVNRMATGDEIYEFLMKDAGQCFDDSDNIIACDCNLYYLACCEKFGHLQLEHMIWKWSFGGSAADHVEAFVSTLYRKKLINEDQFNTLIVKINESRQINSMYNIGKYLICKRDGIPWPKKSDAPDFRKTIKQMVSDVQTSFQKQGYQFYVS
jgi:hypothetical protein